MLLPSRRNIPQDQMYRTRSPRNPFHNVPVNRAPQNNLQRTLSRFQQAPTSITSIATKSAGNISQTLNSIQQVLNVVETATPIVQEYGPIVKNIPAMYRMMKAFKEIDETDETEENNLIEIKENSLNQDKQIVEDEAKQRYSSKSIPRLYI